MLKYLAFSCLLAAATAQQPTIDPDVLSKIFQVSTVAPVTEKPDSIEQCTKKNGEPGVCVRYYLCNNSTVATDGSGIIDIRGGSDCKSYMDLCCSLPDKREPDNPILPPSVSQAGREGCGWRNKDGVGFKITGDKDGEAKFGEFPWMVAILKDLVSQNINEQDGQKLYVFVGGGSLIHPSVVLTAAHYVAGTHKALTARAGEWDTMTTKEIYPYQDRGVTRIEIHKDFNNKTLFYDIAILILESPMDMAPNVGVACLPPPRERAITGTRCFASGWGKDKFDKTSEYQVILKKVEVPVVEHRQCQTALGKARLGRYFQLHSSFMCAGGELGIDACTGDGGSPLVCPIQNEPDRYVQNGIVAWGIGCGKKDVPGVYVDVANLRDWIDDKVKGNGFKPEVYTY